MSHSVPKGMSFDQASGIYVTWPTSYEALTGRGQLKPGMRGLTILRFYIQFGLIWLLFRIGDWVLVHAGK